MLKQIPPLKAGDEIAIVSTARKIRYNEIEFAIATFKAWGLRVRVGKTIGLSYHQFAGTDEERTADMQTMLNDSSIKAIVCARGGYGTVRILDYLDFSAFNRNPKWIVGYSDITILHAHINTYLGYQTIHATMPINFKENTKDSLRSLRNALFGKVNQIKFTTDDKSVMGNATGHIVGGNLSILYSILGTKSGIKTEGNILFLEDLDEYLYHVDRMMVALDRAGKLHQLKALLVGGMTRMNDNAIPYGKTAEEIILEHCSPYNYPILFNVPAGHIDNNIALTLGKKAIIHCNGMEIEISN